MKKNGGKRHFSRMKRIDENIRGGLKIQVCGIICLPRAWASDWHQLSELPWGSLLPTCRSVSDILVKERGTWNTAPVDLEQSLLAESFEGKKKYFLLSYTKKCVMAFSVVTSCGKEKHPTTRTTQSTGFFCLFVFLFFIFVTSKIWWLK